MTWYDEDGKKVAAGKCAGCSQDLQCHNERCDHYEEPDYRHDAGELDQGWQLRSPIGRMETVERIVGPDENTDWRVLIYTTETGPAYCWHAFRSDKVEAIPPRYGTGTPPAVAIVIHEHPYPSGPIRAGIIIGAAGRPYFNSMLVEAHQKRGEGWTIASRLDGRTLSTEHRSSKAQARTVVRQWAKIHAKALGIPVREEATR